MIHINDHARTDAAVAAASKISGRTSVNPEDNEG